MRFNAIDTLLLQAVFSSLRRRRKTGREGERGEGEWSFPPYFRLQRGPVCFFVFFNENNIHLSCGTQKKCPFSLNRGAPSIEVTDTKII